jgi:hypothetical protein
VDDDPRLSIAAHCHVGPILRADQHPMSLTDRKLQ